MQTVLFILLIIGLVGTLGTLFAGLAVMGRGGDTNARYGNKLMRLRVLFQAGTLIVFLIILATRA